MRPILTAMPAVLALTFFPAPAHAFKVNTHIWVAQQVLNDLADGTLSIGMPGQAIDVPVPLEVLDAILAHPDIYLLGHLGPDALPDVLVGQSIVHPGQADGWKANDWMAHLLRASGRDPVASAFVYGYLGHAAADVFAHTQVNQYAGDHFDLSDGETLSELRHIALEGYISRHTPPLVDESGSPLGPPWARVAPSPEIAAFLRNSLIYAPEAQREYERSPNAGHLVALYRYRQGIDRLAEDGIWRSIDIAVAQLAASSFGIPLTSERAGRAVEHIDELLQNVNRGVDATQEQLVSLQDEILRLDQRLTGGALRAIDRASEAAEDVNLSLHRYEETFVEKTCEELRRACRRGGFLLVPTCFFDVPVGCRSAQAVLELRGRILEELGRSRERVLDEVQAAHRELHTAVRSSLDLAHALVDVLQIPTNGLSPVQAYLRAWRADVDEAVARYTMAAAQAMINSMDPSKSAIDPIVEWVDCYNRSLLGIPAVISGCAAQNSAAHLIQSLERLSNLGSNVAAAAVGLPSPRQISELLARVQDELIAGLRREIAAQVIDVLPETLQDVLTVLDEDIDGPRLTVYFTRPEDGSPVGLIPIPDIALRIDRELGRTDGPFDPERYAAAYDSVVLAKLALLDQAGLRELALALGVDSAQAHAAFPARANVVADSFASLDGNHAWLFSAPLRPTLAGAEPRRLLLDAGYPFREGYASAAGLALWRPELRDRLFRQLFRGPLSPALENPAELGLSEILPADYPYRPCDAWPFPDSEDDPTCDGASRPPAAAIIPDKNCPTGCLVDGSCFDTGTFDPRNSCRVCDPEQSQTAFSFAPVGVACGHEPGSPLAGQRASDCHSPGACTAAGTCEAPPLADGTSCDDGRFCSAASTCASGACVATEARDCGPFSVCDDDWGSCACTQCVADDGSCVAERTWYRDSDGDGVGDSRHTQGACAQPAGYVQTPGDCCDTDANAHPGQTAFFTRASACGSWDYDCSSNTSFSFGCGSCGCIANGTCNASQCGTQQSVTIQNGTPHPIYGCSRPDVGCTQTTLTRTLECR